MFQRVVKEAIAILLFPSQEASMEHRKLLSSRLHVTIIGLNNSQNSSANDSLEVKTWFYPINQLDLK